MVYINLRLAYTRRARVALRAFVWKTFDLRQSGVDHDFPSSKSWTFLFLHCAYGPTCEKFWFLGHIYFAKRFLFFLQKNLMWSRLQGIKSRFGFSTFHFLIFCLSIWTQKSCHGRCTPCMICQKIRTRTDADADGHRFLNVCHTKAPKEAIIVHLGDFVWQTFKDRVPVPGPKESWSIQRWYHFF